MSLYPRGKGLGGSSLINTLHYTRCNRLDYDKWALLLNDPEWGYENMLRYFIKSERFRRTNPYVPIDTKYHGYYGPLSISQAIPPLNFSNTILRGVSELGYDIIDYNGRTQLGAAVFQYFTKRGLRFDHEMAFLAPVKYRKNLKILDRSYVTKLEFSKNSKEVKGVIFTRKGKTYIAKCRKEVILSAGAISSPQILMLSGIGPRSHLNSLRIPVVENLPVGNTLLDHPMTVLVFSTNTTVEETQTLRESIRELLKGVGPLTRVLPTDAVGFFRTPVEKNPSYPDVEFFFSNYSNNPLLRRFFGFTNATAAALDQNVSFSITPYVLHTKSSGTLRLKSANPFEFPLIDPNMFSDKNNEDLETLYQAVQIALRLLETPTFRRMNARLAVTQFPGCENTRTLSREYWYCFFRRVTILLYHTMGTCLTGTSPKNGVVDNKLKVFGIENLRVADGSVIPFPLSGHTNGPCTAIGEKVSDDIKDYYGYTDPLYQQSVYIEDNKEYSLNEFDWAL